MDLRRGYEYYHGDNVARLNSGRAGIYHAVRCCGCSRVLIPYYECSTVREFLMQQDVTVEYYPIDQNFHPLLPENINRQNTAVLVVNYFGMLSQEELQQFAARYPHVIIDNTQAFYSKPVESAYCVYSPRKFFGVADGCYVIGEHAEHGLEQYLVDVSEDTAAFLLRRIESGASKNYPMYLENEARIEKSGIRQMSILTRALLDNIDYDYCAQKRRENFAIAHTLFHQINRLPAPMFQNISEDFVPMVYPLVIEKKSLRVYLKEHSIFVGQWWKYLLHEMDESQLEHYYSTYLIPIQIDQRYSEPHLRYTADVIQQYLSEERE